MSRDRLKNQMDLYMLDAELSMVISETLDLYDAGDGVYREIISQIEDEFIGRALDRCTIGDVKSRITQLMLSADVR